MMIERVYKKHGKITLDTKNKNEDLRKADFDINTNTLENRWFRQDTFQAFLINEAETISEEQWLRHTETVLKATGQFNKACQKWEDKQHYDKSKANFIIHMDEFQTKYLDNQETLGSAGIANSVEFEATK